MEQSRSVQIHAPVDRVFAFAEDAENAPAWAEGITAIEILEDTPDKVGSRYRMTIQEGGSESVYDGVVTAHEENAHTRNELERDGTVLTMDRRYRSIPEGTELTMTVSFELEGATKLMAPIVWLMNRHFLKKQALKLKELVEREVAVEA